ncbi:hypothetical protein DUI87_27879 [Hirundo rustica rustica]|uniref:Ig-like domain-containing protein n=1 Tax=Hirundo rustica rustica TaxID=333673 RepID=A0A3M0JLQ7_HIRRU|nr:hypothetical protein DUI87_27879 [Hirundo rustica rustica]
MEPHPRDPGRTAWALPCLLLLALPGVGAQLGQAFSLQQPQTKVSVAAGETLTLNCTTSGIAEPGPVRWLKGWDRGNKTIYDQTTKDPSSRVTRAMNKSKTDFTIHIRNVQPEDTGTYYCVKFVKSDSGVDQVFQRGNGTEVSVLGEWGSGTEVSVLGEWGSGTEVSVQGEWGSGTEVSVLGEWGSGTEVSVQGEWGSGTEVSVLGEWGSGTEVSVQGEWGSGTEVSVQGEWGSGTEVSVQGEWGSGTEVSVQGEWGSGTEVSVQGEWGSGTEVSVLGEWGSGTEVSVLGEWGSGTEVSVQGEWGSGTEVSVQAKPSAPLVSGPEQRAEPGQSVPFTCTTGGFFPKEIGVKWFKNKDPMGAQPPQVTEWGVKTYNISSTVMVTLQEDDVRSQLICEVQHPTLLVPLHGRYQLSRVLRANVSVSWLENGSEIKVENISQPLELTQGLFELRSQVEVQATEEKNGSTIVCVVVHDGRAPASYSAFLWTSNPGQGGLSKGFQMDKGDMLIYIVVGVVCTVLALLVAAILYLIRTKQIKGKSSPSARLHEPEKSSEATTQESDPNNLTYADLNFDKERKTIRRMVEMSQQSEYACIQTNQAPNGDDNLTYADLDMVHLSKAPKRPAPRPEEPALSMPASRSPEVSGGCWDPPVLRGAALLLPKTVLLEALGAM